MENQDQLNLFIKDVEAWIRWKEEHPDVEPDLNRVGFQFQKKVVRPEGYLPKGYLLLYCWSCGRGLCVFEDSDMYQKKRRQKRNPLCPYCKVGCRGVFTHFSSWDSDWKPEIREPVILRKPISKQQREETLKKYGRKCVICGSTENLQIDHIIPVISNGTNDADNLQVLCKACNTSKGADMSISKYRKSVIQNK
jgi:5-methylcytosine-specific restriction endonuclease McrA